MKAFILILLFSSMLLLSSFGQVGIEHERENLAKYWYYKDRLNHEFIQLNDPWKRGACIPASVRRAWDGINSENIQFGDATIDLGYYIGVLATEYALLQRSGQDVTETVKDLFWAIWALDRLDLFAEGTWARIDPAGSNYSTMNGFFIRDDVGADLFTSGSPNANYAQFLTSYNRVGAQPVNKIISDYVQYRIRNNPINIEESKDQVAHLMVGLCLVLKLLPPGVTYVDNGVIKTYNMSTGYSSIQAQARYFLRKVFDHIHPPSANWNYYEWRIINPVSGPVNIGNNLWTWAPGFSSMYSRFFGALNPDLSLLDLLDFGSIIEHMICNFQWMAQVESYNVIYGSSENGRLQGIMALNFQLLSGYENRPSEISNKATISGGEYYQIPLLASVMNDLAIFPPTNASSFHCTQLDYLSLLESAPCFGPYNHGGGDFNSYNFSSTSLLVHPQRRGGAYFPGEYNGLDYMFLHNLYLLAFHNSHSADMKNLYRTYVTETMPWNRSGSLGQGSSVNPIEIPCWTIIDANNIINPGGYVSYRAGNAINLNPGFLAEVGSSFSAYIDDIACFSAVDLQRTTNQEGKITNVTNILDNNIDSFILFPTVSTNLISIQTSMKNIHKLNLRVTNISGDVVFEKGNISVEFGQAVKIDISGFVAGVYFCSINSENISKTIKFIKID